MLMQGFSASAVLMFGARKLFVAGASVYRASQVVLVVKNPPANAGDLGDMGSIPRSGRSPGGGHGHPLLCGESRGQRSLEVS